MQCRRDPSFESHKREPAPKERPSITESVGDWVKSLGSSAKTCVTPKKPALDKPVGADKFPGVPVDAPIKSEVGARSREKSDAVIDQFQVEKNVRYKADRQGKGETYCNIFANDVTKAQGCEIPHTFNDKTGEPGPGAYQHNANGMVDWMHKHGEKKGWKKVSAEEAQKLANEGKPAVATYKNNDGGSGHLAVVRASDDPFDATKGPVIAQAGVGNSNKTTVSSGMSGVANKKEIEYWAHE